MLLLTSLTWPATYFQYKFALLSLGFDAPVMIIFLSIVATSIASVIPVPAALGFQEAGQVSVFSAIGLPSLGFALSIMIRLKDLLTTFAGFILLSHEGLSVFEVLKQKKV